MKFKMKSVNSYYLLLLSCLLIHISCDNSRTADDQLREKIDFLSDNSWGKVSFQLPEQFHKSKECQLMWSEAFFIRCYESEYGQLEILALENNGPLSSLDIFSNTIDLKLDTLSRSLPNMQLVRVDHSGSEKEHIMNLEYFENGTQKRGYHLEQIVARPANKFVFRFYSEQIEAEQISEILQFFETIEIFSARK